MRTFCLPFPVYFICNNVRNVLQSVRMLLFHIVKLNEPITCSTAWNGGMRVLRGCKAWWEHNVGRWNSVERQKEKKEKVESRKKSLAWGGSVHTAYWKQSLQQAIFWPLPDAVSGISTAKENGSWGWMEGSLGFIHYEGSSTVTTISYCPNLGIRGKLSWGFLQRYGIYI